MITEYSNSKFRVFVCTKPKHLYRKNNNIIQRLFKGLFHQSGLDLASNYGYFQSQNQDMCSFSLNTHKTVEVQTYLSRIVVYRLYFNIYFTKAKLLLHFYNNKAYST